MAAVRAGAVGLSKQARFVMYSSTRAAGLLLLLLLLLLFSRRRRRFPIPDTFCILFHVFFRFSVVVVEIRFQSTGDTYLSSSSSSRWRDPGGKLLDDDVGRGGNEDGAKRKKTSRRQKTDHRPVKKCTKKTSSSSPAMRKMLSIEEEDDGGAEGSEWDSRDSDRAARPSVYGKRYGVAMSNAETVRQRWKMRRRLSDLKVRLCDVTLVLAISGLALAMLDVELTATRILERFVNASDLSFILRAAAIVTTIALLFFLLFYHFIDIKIQLVETGTTNWRVGVTSERVLNTLLELAICAICPIPETGSVAWPQLSNIAEKTRQYVSIPVSVLLTLPMFLRFYIACRYMVLHSSQHQDTATRTIASLNHIAVDFRFVLKSEMYERPLFVLSIASLLFWCVVSWMLTQCERYAYPSISGFQHFADYLWFEIITFFSIGYGDVQVNTYCGRGLAMLTAIVGTLFSSTLIALISRKMILTTSEKRVNHIIAENNITNKHKNAAACVLQNTWRTVLRARDYQKSTTRRNHQRLAKAQRMLLCSVLTFRKTRWKLRMQMEDEDDYFTARRAFNETEERLQKVRQRQSQMDAKISTLFENVEALTAAVMARKCYLREY